MPLADRVIKEVLDGGAILPFSPVYVQPSTYDIHLGGRFGSYLEQYDGQRIIYPAMELNEDAEKVWVDVEEGGFYILAPGQFTLACSLEYFHVPPNMQWTLAGKSSRGRMGIFIHVTAGLLDPGFEGVLVLELYNASPIPRRLRPGQSIGQINFDYLTGGAAERPYGSPLLGSHYQGQQTTTGARW